MSNYVRIKNFGFTSATPETTNPDHKALGMCLSDTLDRKFKYGSAVGANSGPRSMQCQNYMAQRCADKWDGFCEYYYQQYGPNGSTPLIPGAWPNSVWRPWEEAYGLNFQMSLGDQMLKNAAERKYCKLQNCTPTVSPLDPTDPNSVKVATYADYTGCVPVCKVDPQTIDKDPIMNRVLQNPTIAAGTLVNICNTSKREGINLTGTKIGQLCDQMR